MSTPVGTTVWLTGLPSAGKTTIAAIAARDLTHLGYPVELLDGDELRRTLCQDLGFRRPDREENVRRIGWVAQMLARNGIIVLVPVIAPFRDCRAAVRARHLRCAIRYLEVHVDTAVELCAERDVKGLYARARAGLLTGFTGVDDPYEPSTNPDLRLQTDNRQADDCAAELVAFVLAHIPQKDQDRENH